MNINKYVGVRIRELRKKRKINQAELGKVLGVSQNTISGYEKGDIELGNVNLFKVAEYFGVKADDFFPPTTFKQSNEVLEKAKDKIEEFRLDDLNFLKQLTEKTYSLNKEERERFLEGIKFTVDYYNESKKG